MLFALYLILFLGGMFVMSLAFNVPAFQGVVFVIGILLVSAALASPMVASAIENRGENPHR